jgi:hypothetical protein
MLITRTSPLTGKINSMEIDVSPEQMEELARPGRGRLIQQIFPFLSPMEREFIKTGYTPEDWDEMFKEEMGS